MTEDTTDQERNWREFLPDEVLFHPNGDPYVMVELQMQVPVRLHMIDEEGNELEEAPTNIAPPVDEWMQPCIGAAQVLSIAREGWKYDPFASKHSPIVPEEATEERIQQQLNNWAKFWLFDRLDMRHISPLVRITPQQLADIKEGADFKEANNVG